MRLVAAAWSRNIGIARNRPRIDLGLSATAYGVGLWFVVGLGVIGAALTFRLRYGEIGRRRQHEQVPGVAPDSPA